MKKTIQIRKPNDSEPGEFASICLVRSGKDPKKQDIDAAKELVLLFGNLPWPVGQRAVAMYLQRYFSGIPHVDVVIESLLDDCESVQY